MAGTLLSLANRYEPLSHGSLSWVTNIAMLSFRAGCHGFLLYCLC